MSASVLTLFTETTLDGFPLWVVLLICGGVFLAGFMDAIAGGRGIISVPVYLMAFSGLPTHFVLGTNKALLLHRHRVFHRPLHPPGVRSLAAVPACRRAGGGRLRLRDPGCAFTRRMWC